MKNERPLSSSSSIIQFFNYRSIHFLQLISRAIFPLLKDLYAFEIMIVAWFHQIEEIKFKCVCVCLHCFHFFFAWNQAVKNWTWTKWCLIDVDQLKNRTVLIFAHTPRFISAIYNSLKLMIFYFSDKSVQMESSICNDSQFERSLHFFYSSVILY